MSSDKTAAPYAIKLTRLASAIAKTKYSAEAVLARAREELDREAEDGFLIEDFLFHAGKPRSGPFAGQSIQIPQPDSVDD